MTVNLPDPLPDTMGELLAILVEQAPNKANEIRELQPEKAKHLDRLAELVKMEEVAEAFRLLEICEGLL